MSNSSGYKFELYCAELYKDLGKLGVKHNIQYNFRRVVGKKLVRRAQVDIEYLSLLMGLATVECKYHKSTNVHAGEMESFADTLRYLRRDSGIFMTNSSYSSTAAKIASKRKIKLLDENNILDMEKKRNNIIRRLFSGKTKSLEQLIRETRLGRDYRNPSIRTMYVLV